MFILFTVVIATVTFMISNIGMRYGQGLRQFTTTPIEQDGSQPKRVEIKKIIIQKKDSSTCIEVSSDAVARTYDQCGERVTDARRINDSESLLDLFQFLHEHNLSAYETEDDGYIYKITVETDEGTRVYFIRSNNAVSSIQNLIRTIELLEGDITTAIYPSPSSYQSVKSSTYVFQPVASSGQTNVSPATGIGALQPPTFTCEYIDTPSGKKPVNVSNIICSGDPIPAQ